MVTPSLGSGCGVSGTVFNNTAANQFQLGQIKDLPVQLFRGGGGCPLQFSWVTSDARAAQCCWRHSKMDSGSEGRLECEGLCLF